MIRKLATLIIATSLAILSQPVLPLYTDTKAPRSLLITEIVMATAQDLLNGTITASPLQLGTPYRTGSDTGVTLDDGTGFLAFNQTPTSTQTTQTSPTVDQNVLGQYDQAIANTQAGINRLPSQLQSGFSGIDTSYQDAINQLLLGKNQGEQSYKTNKQSSATGYVGAKNTIGAQAGDTLNGLLRLLGSRGAGGGSAARGTGRGTARGAVSRGASLQRADVGQTFGENNQALDTNWNNYLTGYNNEVSSAGSQRDRNKQTLQQSIDTNRATLLQSLAQLQAQRAEAAGGNSTAAAQPYLDQANAILDRTSNYTVAPINYQTQAYTPPDVASYTTTPNATPTFNDSAANDYFSPYLQKLLGKRQQPGIA